MRAAGGEVPRPDPVSMRRGVALTQNDVGEWVPAIPLPLTWIRRECGECGLRFWTRDGYRGHYALAHILVMS